MSGICIKQKNEQSCNSLRYKDEKRCTYEKNWFSYIRGGNCFISEDLIKHIISNLHPFIDINWDTYKLLTLPSQDDLLPNPDNLTKSDIVDILHDLTHHIRSVFKETDIITVLEEKHGEKLINLSEQELLYYMYLFSFIVYVSQFLSSVDFKSLLRDDKSQALKDLINSAPSKQNLLNFVKMFFSLTSSGEHKPKGWKNALYSGILISLFLIGFIPAAFVFTSVLSAGGLTKTRSHKKVYERELRSYGRYLTPNAMNELRQFQTVTQTPRDILEDLVKNDDDYEIHEYLKKVSPDVYIYPYIMQAIKERNLKSVISLMLSPQYKNLSGEDLARLLHMQLSLTWRHLTKKGIMERYTIYKLWNDGAKDFSEKENINVAETFPGLDEVLEFGEENGFDTMEIDIVKGDVSEEERERLFKEKKTLYDLKVVKEFLKDTKYKDYSLLELYKLQTLWLSDKKLTTIPKEIGNLFNLKEFYLSNNQLTEIPKELGNLTNLQILNLSNNQLTEIPKELGNLTNLEELNLGNNQLTEVPKELGNLTNLETLGLYNNKLTKIPKELGNLINIETLSLYNNQLIEIPKELGNLSNLQYLVLRNNKLTEIPKEVRDIIIIN